jgi:hypothetical protein
MRIRLSVSNGQIKNLAVMNNANHALLQHHFEVICQRIVIGGLQDLFQEPASPQRFGRE